MLAMGARAGRVGLLWLLGIASLQFSADAALTGQVSRGEPDRAPGQVLVRLPSDLPEAARRDLLAGHRLRRVSAIPQIGVELLAAPEGRGAGEVLGELAAARLARWAEPNYLCWVALAEPNDPAYRELIGDLWVQWPAHQLSALVAWATYPDHYFTAADRPQEAPIVALIDTGVDPGHPDFMNPEAAGADVPAGGQLMLSAARTFLAGQSSDLAPEAVDEHGHGTHLAGLIAAGANNGLTAGDGIAGLGYPARLLPIRVTAANGVATHADLARAIIYAADQEASVIVMGMEGPTWSQTLQAAVDYAWNRGCLLLAPAGNTGDGTPMFPGACPHVLGVAGVDASAEAAAYSTRGHWVGLAAPGGDAAIGVYSTLPTYACTLRDDLTTPAYGWLFGSSQAAAHVAAAAALYAGRTGLRPQTGDEGARAWQSLQASATPTTDAAGRWNQVTGYGLLSPAALVNGETCREPELGSLVGRVLLEGGPAIGAAVTATPEGGGEAITVTTAWPAGAYRIPNLPVGEYRVTAEAGSGAGVWERVRVRPGCDRPAVDFTLGGPAAAAELVSAEIPTAAVLGSRLDLRFAYRNAGESTWTRADGYALVQVTTDRPLGDQPDQVNLGRDQAIAPGGRAEFALSLTAPDRWGLYTTSWRLAQQGGAGWLAPAATGTVSVTSFLDVPADHWAVASVEAASAAGIVRGYGGDLYRPDWPVTRDQMAVYISRALAGGDCGVPDGPGLASFSDVPTDHWAFKYVEFAKAQDVVAGYDDGTYRPALTLDRAQLAVFVARAVATPTGEKGLAAYVPPATPTFPDVPATSWAYKHIEYLADPTRQVVHGYPDGLYRPDWTVTRDQMAVYVASAFALPV